MKKMLVLTFLVLFLTVFSAHFVYAQDNAPQPVTDDQVNAVARQLYCPVCENIPLDVCGTKACEEWRGLIREKLMEGWSAVQIKDYFADQYGDRVLGAPPARGINWIVYILPSLGILLVAVFVIVTLILWWQKSNRNSKEVQLTSSSQNDEYIQRMEEELKKR